MSRCPVCQTRYPSHQHDRCPGCGWDVQPLSLMIGLLPEVAQKETVRLEWAKQLWSKAKATDDQVRQIQEGRDRDLLRLEKAEKTAADLTEQLQQSESKIAYLQVQLDQVQSELIQEPSESPEPVVPPPEWTTPIPAPLQQAESRLQSFTIETVLIQADTVVVQPHTVKSLKQPLEECSALEMVYIPAGRFLMGSPDTEAGRDIHEGPQHPVTIAPFLMSRFPITQAQWKAIAGLPKIARSLSLSPAEFEGDDRPVEQVSWYDVIEFCARLSLHTGQLHRLPSEAEWEYACRAGTTTPFHFGETITADLANYDGIYTYSFGRAGLYRQETTPVGLFAVANRFGLSEMHGNVWEWCADVWHETYHEAPEDGRVWALDDDGLYRVLRGGAWYCLPELCRSAQRHWNQPDMTGSGIGFRVVCELG